MARKDNDLQRINELIEIMKKNDLVEVEIKHGEDKILLKRSGGTIAMPAATMPVAGSHIPVTSSRPDVTEAPVSEAQTGAEHPEEELVEIKSPMVGTFYATSSPDSEPYVEVDSQVGPQTVVCIVEAMKVMNEIKAETSGVITETLVTNGQAVEYGQVLFKVRPD